MNSGDDDRSPRVAALVADVVQAADLGDAFRLVDVDPATSLTKSRVVLERILKSILVFEERPVGDKPAVGQMLKDESVRGKTPAAVQAAMEYVNRVASADGAHAGVASSRTAGRAIDHICDVVEWYSAEYLTSGLSDNFGNAIDRKDALIVYVSTGGTCRCAMANVVTRYMLKNTQGLDLQRTMSAALHQPTRSTMSPEAVQVVSEELGFNAAAHRTISLDDRFLRRADLILAMDSKLLQQLPTAFRDKSSLFAEFYGGLGNIEDPWGRGLEAYRARFAEIRQLISQGIPRLQSWLTNEWSRRAAESGGRAAHS